MNLPAISHLAVWVSKDTLAFFVAVVEALLHILHKLGIAMRASLSISEEWQAWGLGGPALPSERSGTLEGGHDA